MVYFVWLEITKVVYFVIISVYKFTNDNMLQITRMVERFIDIKYNDYFKLHDFLLFTLSYLDVIIEMI